MAEAQLSHEGEVATIAMRSERPVITFTDELASSLESALDRVEAAPAVRCLLLTASGPTFLAGADLGEVAALDLQGRLAYNRRLLDLTNRLEALTPPVVAALNGSALGGGLEVALACSVRIAAAGVRLGLPEVKLGLVAASGGIVRLARTVAPGAAQELMLTGALVTAEQALPLGLVERVVPADALAAEARDLAAEIASRAPLATAFVKAAVRDTASMPTLEAVEEVHRRLAGISGSADAAEGIAAFLEKRPPRFQRR